MCRPTHHATQPHARTHQISNPHPTCQRSVVKLILTLGLIRGSSYHHFAVTVSWLLRVVPIFVTFYKVKWLFTVSCGQSFQYFYHEPIWSLWICKRLGWWTTSAPNFHQVIIHLLEHQKLLHRRSPKPSTLGHKSTGLDPTSPVEMIWGFPINSWNWMLEMIHPWKQ